MRTRVLDEGGAEAVADFELTIERLFAEARLGGLGGRLAIDLDIAGNETLLVV